MRMILKYFFPKKNFTWEKLEELSAKKPGKWTWPTQMQINLQKMGLEVVIIDAFNAEAFVKEGASYLQRIWGKEMANAQVQNSDISQERLLYKKLIESVSIEKRVPSLADLKRLLDDGYLIECAVNAALLNDTKHYAGHSVVVFGYDRSHVFLHDPGLPPYPNRKVTYARFKKAWMYPNDSNQTLTAIRHTSRRISS